MTPNRENPGQGRAIEHRFANSIKDHPEVLETIKGALRITGEIREIEIVGGRHRKTDVVMTFPGTLLRCSVKSFSKSSGQNHLERRKLSEFCRRNQISNANQKFLEFLFQRKGLDKRARLVMPEEEERVRKIFSPIEVGVSAMVGNDHPQIFVLFCMDESKFHIYDMQKQVIPRIQGGRIGFTSRASNIEIGEYVVVQRHGAERDSRPNDVQIKMKVKKFFEDVDPLCEYQP